MIVVKIELWPRGLRHKARELGRVVIANEGTGTDERGNYKVALSHAGVYAGQPGAWKGGTVVGHLRKLSPYHLVQSAIASALKGRSTTELSDMIEGTRDGNQTLGEQQLQAVREAITETMKEGAKP